MQVDAVILLELLDKVVHDAQVEVVPAQERVTACGSNLEYAIAHIEDGNIKRTAAQIVDGNDLILLLIESVGKRRSCRFVDDTQDFEACDLARILCRIALGIVEVSRDGNDRLGDRLAQVGFGIALDLGQDHGRNLRRAVFLLIEGYAHVTVGRCVHRVGDALASALYFGIICLAAHETLDRKDRVLRICDRLVARHATDDPLVVFINSDYRGNKTLPLSRGDDDRFAALHNSRDRVGGAEVDANDFCHNKFSSVRVQVSGLSHAKWILIPGT